MHRALKILHVEDDPIFRLNFSDFLHDHGFAVCSVSNQNEAKAAFFSFRPDIVILDLDLNGARMAGRDLARYFLGLNSETPILLCSSVEVKCGVRVAKETGIAGFMRKNDDLEEVVSMVRGLI